MFYNDSISPVTKIVIFFENIEAGFTMTQFLRLLKLPFVPTSSDLCFTMTQFLRLLKSRYASGTPKFRFTMTQFLRLLKLKKIQTMTTFVLQ